MKTKEELNTLKDEVKALNAKLAELTKEELEQVSGGLGISVSTIVQAECMQCASLTRHKVVLQDNGNAKFTCMVCQKTTTRPSPF